MTWICEYCGFECESYNEIVIHLRNCANVPGEIENKFKEMIDQGECNECEYYTLLPTEYPCCKCVFNEVRE